MMSSKINRLLVIFFCAALAALVSCGNKSAEKNAAGVARQQIDTVSVLCSSISDCARLATTEYRIHKIVAFDDRIVVRGKIFSQPFSREIPMGDRKIAIPIDVTLRGYVDFADFGKDNIKRRGGKITVTLPDPQIMISASKIDHKGVKKIVDPLRSNFKQEEIETYTRQGMDSIAMAIPQLGIVEAARVSAAQVLVPIIREMGYAESDITIQFRPAVSDRTILHWADIEQLLKR